VNTGTPRIANDPTLGTSATVQANPGVAGSLPATGANTGGSFANTGVNTGGTSATRC
jgi:hypothetical protein